MTIDDQIPLANWTRHNRKSALQDMLIATSQPGILSFALGLPAAELFPTDQYMQAMDHVLSTDERALQYGPPFQPLKQHVVELMKLRGVSCREEQIFLTAGAQQGASLLTRLLLDRGKKVIIEEMTYTGFQQVLDSLQPDILTVPTDPRTGMEVEAVESLLDSGVKPALIYCIPDGHNPLSVSLSRSKREQLVELARHYGFPIIEDDPYGFLYYEDTPVPPMRALDDRWILYVGTFSKILAPALRAGWIVVPEEFIPHLSNLKEATDIDMAPLSHRAISAYLDTGHLTGHLLRLRQEYRRRRDTMLGSLAEHFPAGTHWENPSSGLFIWGELPDGVDTGELLRVALETERVAFLPGQAFRSGGTNGSTNFMRLNFSNSSVERIEDGIARLGRVLKQIF
jgi:2-aminoadipate transaminase